MPRSNARPTVDLPNPVTRFIGRRAELDQVRRHLAESRLVTLTGIGGVGKTRLAVEAARSVARAYPGGVRMADLSPLTEPGQVSRVVADALGVVDRSPRLPVDAITDRLGDAPTLLVLDNCEHVLEGAVPLVGELLGRAQGLTVLATSRRNLAIPGEHLLAVPPLALPDDGALASADELARSDAVQLLVDRTRALRPGFELTPADRSAALRLCARLDGLPLAIELAATRLRTLSLDQLLDRLEGRFALLGGVGPGAGRRQATLRAVMDWSHSLCSPEERLLWARLSVFTGGFDLEAAEGVCAGGTAGAGLGADQVLDVLDRLVAQSIVLAEPAGPGMRFRLLDTIRHFGRERLAELGEEQELRRRHRNHYLGVAREVAGWWCTPRQREGLARLRTEHGNFRAALEISFADPEGVPAGLELASALRQHWYADAFLGEGRGWLDQGLTCAPPPAAGSGTPGYDRARMDALWVAAWVSLLQGDDVVGLERLAECRELAARCGDARALGFTHSLQGTALLFGGDTAGAARELSAGLDVFERIGETEGLLWGLFQYAISLSHQGLSEAAQAACRRSIRISEAAGESLCRSYTLWVLGYDTWRQGDPEAADRWAEAGLAVQQSFQDPVGAALIMELMSWIAASRGDPVRACRVQGAADSVWSLIGTTLAAFGPPLQSHRQACLARIAAALDEPTAEAERRRGRRPTVDAAIASITEDAAAGPRPAPGGQDQSGSGAPERGPLTAREWEVALLVAQGLSNRAVAARLVISKRTVDGHVERILAKLDFTARTQVAAWVATREERPAPASG